MQVNKLRLAGFKSFVDATELSIAPGLTGVVGPNGCGKSNLLEALRWVMGETSPKSMRGEGMDNVIFGGSANRPSRDVAEVVLALDNAERDAPAAYNDQHEIEVSRRIERGAGSTYRINGREVRARDVQLLFADLVTGAHSTAMVSQGHIGALIEAKPIQRRVLLEEAAGITGLHSRRHEAELRLSGAETNLERLDDVLQALDGQLKGLKRQAAQARRYRRLSEHIRRQEAILLHLQWSAAGVAVAEAEVRLEEAEATVNQRTELAAAAATRQAENAAVLPRLRQAEAAAAAELQRLLVTGGELEAEEARLTQARDENRRRREQIGGDLEREKTLAADAHAACRRLEDERTALEAARQGEAEAETAAKGEVEAAQSELGEAEGRLTDLTERVAAIGARKADLDRRIEELERRMARLGDRRREVAEELRRLEASAAEGATPGRPSFARRSGLREGGSAADAALAERRVDEARAAADEAEGALAAARGGEEQAREAARLMDAEWAGLTAEESALARLSTTDDRAAWPPVIEALTVDPGFEAALAAALGDDLTAS
ncbi:MAG: AAA family ATPase, partial [Kiloniellales bacterium]